MLDNIKHYLNLKNIDKYIAENNYDLALEKLNELARADFKPSVTYLKRGKLCKKLLMLDNAYADFTYVIENCADKKEAYYERLFLNFEISNFYEAICDANTILTKDDKNFEVKRIKILSHIFSMQDTIACEYILNTFGNNNYKSIRFLFNEVAVLLARDEFAKGLRVLEIIDRIDKDNPIKILKEANIYALAGNKVRQKELLNKLDAIFPSYFISHFRYFDMYQQIDPVEVAFLMELSLFDKKGIFAYPMKILEGYKNHLSGQITEARNSFKAAVELNPTKPEGYVLLAQTLQLMSGYDNPEYRFEAEANYKKAMAIFMKEKRFERAEDMRKQISHLNSGLVLTLE